MANFDTLTMGEKYTESKDFLMRVKAVKNLKPNFSSRDVLRAVASKFYGNDIREINNYLNFIKTECGEFSSLDELVELPLDERAQAFMSGLENDVKNKEKAYNAKRVEKENKEKALFAAEKKRNDAQDALIKAEKKEAWKDVTKMLLLGAALLLGVGVIISAGGIMGAAGGIAGFISNLTFTQMFSLVFMVFVGHACYTNFIKGKKDKGKKSKRQEKRKANQEKLASSAQKAQESVDALQAEVAESRKAFDSAEADFKQAKGKELSESASMANYRKTSNLDMQLDAGVNELGVKYAETKEKMTKNNAAEDELKTLDSCYYYHVGQLYLAASLKKLKTEQEIAARVQMAKLAIDQVSNPLSMNVNNDYDKTLDEMFASI